MCTLTGHTGIVYSIAISPDNQTIVSGSQDGTIKIWRPLLRCDAS
ncbi:WD40 domain-containing protein [Planktothrix agardhii 1808]|nr:WD40 domain-containing protein [Planktothrix agardhii 1809]MCB8779400.1 WD40 domain-containing protein [Planktothrix agardhii 1031]MCB8783820.1 WD40 domain-containing protein [Planktothrix agardhii 1808]MCB8787815.1 WD40 domain-containing protein [Planktothrix agardhii 1025]